MNAIAALGLKPIDLYKISFKEFLSQHPEYKKMSKDIQNQRYIIYEAEREKNIERCISKRQEIISHTKKVKPNEKKINNYEDETQGEEEANSFRYDKYDLIQRYRLRNNTEDNYALRKNYSTKRQNFLQNNKILITEHSYIMNNSSGKKSEITKEDLEKLACIKKEKKKLEKKSETKDEHLMRYLKVELDRAKKLKKVKQKLNEKDEKLKKFMDFKNKGIKYLENERYQDHQDVYERQKIYEKLLSNYDQKVYFTKKQQQEQNKSSNLNNINTEKTKNKMEELKEQIKDYERKNNEYKQKISDIFELKDKNGMEKKLKDRHDKKDESPSLLTSSYMAQKKLNDLEEKFEIEKYRREKALMQNMNKFQDKINSYLEKNEEKQLKIKNAILDAENKRKAKREGRTNHFNEVQKNIKNNELKNETKRQKLLDDIEKKNLKDYAIKQEKIRMNEERKKMNKLNQEEREALKLRIQEIINNEDNIDEGEKNEEIINKLINESHNNNE